MSGLAYYSPLWVGALLCAGVVAAGYDDIPGKYRALALWLGCPLAGLLCQLAMIGAQGAFAQVLPVPMGRSIRGRAAFVAGSLVVLAVGALAVAAFIAFEQVTRAAFAAGIVSAASAIAAGVVYAWSLPAAVSDFGKT